MAISHIFDKQVGCVFHKVLEKTEPATIMAGKYRTLIPSHEVSYLYFLAVRLLFTNIEFNPYFFRNDQQEFPLEFLNLIFYDNIESLEQDHRPWTARLIAINASSQVWSCQGIDWHSHEILSNINNTFRPFNRSCGCWRRPCH